MKEPLTVCKKECNKEMTLADVTTSTDCNFCDVPYILMEADKLNNYNELVESKETFEAMVDEYKKNIRLFFKPYANDTFNGVINTLDINFKTKHPLYPCEIICGWQEIPLRAITDFCEVFDYYLPNIQINEKDTLVFDYDIGEYEKEYTYEYNFKKKR